MISGILFDKDGTLFDFQATWSVWASQVLNDLSQGEGELLTVLAHALGFNVASGNFRRDSIVIAHTTEQVAQKLQHYVPHMSSAELVMLMNRRAAELDLVQSVPLAPLLLQLKARGLKLGVATNDSEDVAITQLARVGIHAEFDFIAGADSGHGAKPDPEMLLAFASKHGLAPSQIVMVGDSEHDLTAGRAAGMHVVGVLTGPATEAELLPLADTVLGNIGDLVRWIDAQLLSPVSE